MNVTDFFKLLMKKGFTRGEVFSLIAYTTVDVNKITTKELMKFIPGFRIILQKMIEHESLLDDLLGINPEPES